jgi:twinkle protein
MSETQFKDCNECLQAGAALEAMQACLSRALDFAPEKVVPAEFFREAFMAEWFDGGTEEQGLVLPWEFPFRIRPGELTVWTGVEKSGKSTLLGFVQVCLMAQGERCLLASFEVTPVKSLKKLSRQVWGGKIFDGELDVEECKRNATAAFDYLADKLWIYNHVGIGQWRELLEDMRWARRRHGITQFVIDNFMRIGIVKDDYAQQAEAITAFAAAAIELDCHIHIVVHQNKAAESGKRSVAGAFEIIANAHNIVEVQRDVAKGERVSELFEKKKTGSITQEEFDEKMRTQESTPDGKFILHAAREGEHQNASKYLWFLWKSQQYADQPKGHRDHVPICFIKQQQPTTEGKI